MEGLEAYHSAIYNRNFDDVVRYCMLNYRKILKTLTVLYLLGQTSQAGSYYSSSYNKHGDGRGQCNSQLGRNSIKPSNASNCLSGATKTL